jgi:hypothetical protein
MRCHVTRTNVWWIKLARRNRRAIVRFIWWVNVRYENITIPWSLTLSTTGKIRTSKRQFSLQRVRPTYKRLRFRMRYSYSCHWSDQSLTLVSFSCKHEYQRVFPVSVTSLGTAVGHCPLPAPPEPRLPDSQCESMASIIRRARLSPVAYSCDAVHYCNQQCNLCLPDCK